MTTSLVSRELSPDAEAILLLSASLGKRTRGAESPLTPREYDALADSLRHADLRPHNVLFADTSVLIDLTEHLPPAVRKHVTPERLRGLRQRGGQLALALSKWSGQGIWVITRADAGYPSRYKQKLGRSAPPVVFGIGDRSLLEHGGIAVVGSRNPDPASEAFTRHIATWAADAGVQVVSGAARGVDEIAMVTCAAQGGTALGVVGESLLRLSIRREFREQILRNRLTLISSYDPEAPFTAANAMGRNRWVYALAERCVVVACSEGRGGTWAGAVEALKNGVPVFVKTGNPDRPGNEALLHYGAQPVPDDLSELLRTVSAKNTPAVKVDHAVFTAVLPFILHSLREPVTVKELAVRLDLTQAQLKRWLGRMVAEGTVVKQGSHFSAASSKVSSDTRQISLLSIK